MRDPRNRHSRRSTTRSPTDGRCLESTGGIWREVQRRHQPASHLRQQGLHRKRFGLPIATDRSGGTNPLPGAPRLAGAVGGAPGARLVSGTFAHYGQVADTILTDVTRKDGMVVVDDCVVLLVDGELCDVVDEDVTLSTVPVICTL